VADFNFARYLAFGQSLEKAETAPKSNFLSSTFANCNMTCEILR
jgi:hypothetical protein